MIRSAPDQPPADAVPFDAKWIATDKAGLSVAFASGDPVHYDSAIKARLLDLGLLHASMNTSVTALSSIHRPLDGLNTASSIILFMEHGIIINQVP